MGWAKPSPAHGPKSFETKTMVGLGRSDFFMDINGPQASVHALLWAHGPDFDSKKTQNC
jgi:hypothetical protein